MESNRHIEIIKAIIELLKEFLMLMIHAKGQHPVQSKSQIGDDEEMTRLDVIKYLGICPRTYIRRVNDGTLKPRKLPGGHRYFKRDLTSAYNESKRRGRI